MNIAMISGWHVHARGYGRRVNAFEGCKIAAIWDEDKARGQKWADDVGTTYYENLDDVLNNPEIDAVVICTATNVHKDVITACAKAGKHVFTEKVLATTGKEAKEIAEAVKESGVKFVISYPHMTFAPVRKMKEMADAGLFGKLNYFRVRNVHGGSIHDWLPAHFYDKVACGGGAMMDLGAHPMYLMAWFLGKPVSVTSMFTNVTDRPVEDNAICLLEFANGAIGVSETGFVSNSDPYIVEISGDRGYARYDGKTLCYHYEGQEGWINQEGFKKNPPEPLEYFLDCLNKGEEPTLYTLDEAVVLSEIMDAAYRSYESGKKETV